MEEGIATQSTPTAVRATGAGPKKLSRRWWAPRRRTARNHGPSLVDPRSVCLRDRAAVWLVPRFWGSGRDSPTPSSDTESCVLFLFLFLSLFQSFLLFPIPLLKQEGGRYVVSYHIHRHMIRFLNCNDGDGRVLHTVVLLQPSGFQIQVAFNVACHFFSFGKVVQVT